MAYDGWIEFAGVELVNLSRTAQLAEAMSIPQVWTNPEDVQWIQDALSGVDYDDITTAPWYDAGYPASAEFAGLVPLGFPGLDDSTLTSTPIEYITDGGHSGRPRNSTLSIVGSGALVGMTQRGVEYGKRWLDRTLRGGANLFCSGGDLRYFRYGSEGAPEAHRRDVRLTRGASITRKTKNDCSATWWVSFTLTCADPYEYSQPQAAITTLGPTGTSGPTVTSHGAVALTEGYCPSFDYTPLYDPLYPALVPGPSIPDFYPDGWLIESGMTFDRFWAVVAPSEPSSLNVIPTFVLTSPTDARMVRLSIWPGNEYPVTQCDPLFSVVISYLPADMEFTIDSEQKAAYVWDGVSEGVRRADSLIYSPDANPVQWTAFNDPSGLLVTLDLFGSSSEELAGIVEASMTLTSKSD